MPVLELAKKTIVTSTPKLGRVGLVLFENGAFPFSGLWLLFLKEGFPSKDRDVRKRKPLIRISMRKQFLRDMLRLNTMELTSKFGLSINIVAHVLLNSFSPSNIIGRGLGRSKVRTCTGSSRSPGHISMDGARRSISSSSSSIAS